MAEITLIRQQGSISQTSRILKVPAPYLGLARVLTAQNKSDDALKLLAQLAGEVSGEESRLQAKAEEVRVHHAADNPDLAAAAAQEVTSAIQSGAPALSATATLDLAETFMIMGNKTVASDLLQFVIRNNHEDEVLASRVLAVFETGGMGEEGRALVPRHASRRLTRWTMASSWPVRASSTKRWSS